MCKDLFKVLQLKFFFAVALKMTNGVVTVCHFLMTDDHSLMSKTSNICVKNLTLSLLFNLESRKKNR